MCTFFIWRGSDTKEGGGESACGFLAGTLVILFNFIGVPASSIYFVLIVYTYTVYGIDGIYVVHENV